MGIKVLVSAAVTGLLLGGSVGTTQAIAQGAAVATDSSFVQTAGSLALLQVKLGKLAGEKGASAAVREFGKRMVADYTQVSEELAAGAKQAAYPAPVILRQHQQLFERFQKTGRGSFDKKYMAQMVNDHGEAVRLFQHEAQAGRVASLKALASRMLPTVQQHLSLATETAGSVGADVTAAAQGERQGT